ncbi:hypothetical protein [Oceanobacillus kimchii]|uniref:hypothetical protein n=1 Tax=Oceanobacillus kimchii TaxID=746691 RepID=UPI003B01666E
MNVNNTKFYLEGNPIDENEIWEDIETGSNYWVSLDKNRLPYRINLKCSIWINLIDIKIKRGVALNITTKKLETQK